ncbi:MAG: hypothetical protein M1822_001751 [Bathelium mastoideum]|nr:MAG: hypothetical protein M1822_001751 [Bathelium mastoideum]
MVEATVGGPMVVVWAHFVLGLHVTVRYRTCGKLSEARFPQTGEFSEQVLIYSQISPKEWDGHSRGILVDRVTLFSASTGEELFTIKDTQAIDSIRENFKSPVRGIGKEITLKRLPELKEAGREKLLHEFEYTACGFALCIADKLLKAQDDRDSYSSQIQSTQTRGSLSLQSNEHHIPLQTDANQIIAAFSMLFDLKEQDVSAKCFDYKTCYTDMALSTMRDPPNSLQTVIKEWSRAAFADWRSWRDEALNISILILSFANIADIEACAGLLLFPSCQMISSTDIRCKILEWDGKNKLFVKQDSWLEVIALMMTGGYLDKRDVRNTALISQSGWSVYISTLAQLDPSYIGKLHNSLERTLKLYGMLMEL